MKTGTTWPARKGGTVSAWTLSLLLKRAGKAEGVAARRKTIIGYLAPMEIAIGQLRGGAETTKGRSWGKGGTTITIQGRGICRRPNLLLLSPPTELLLPSRTCRSGAGVNVTDTLPGVAATTRVVQCVYASITQRGQIVMCVRTSTLTDHGIELRPLTQTPVLVSPASYCLWKC